MNYRSLSHASLRVTWRVARVLAWLSISMGLLAAQDTMSAGPLRLHQVRTIYVAPSSDEFLLLVRARLEKWNAVTIGSKMEEGDAILLCQTKSTIVPAKVSIRMIIAEVSLVDRRSQKIIWRTTKSATFDTPGLADQVIEQLKTDWRQSANEY